MSKVMMKCVCTRSIHEYLNKHVSLLHRHSDFDEGKSVFTDYEKAVKKLCEEVLDMQKHDQIEAFEKYWTYYFYDRQQITGNSTIFKIGMDKFENIYEAFKIVGVSDEYQQKLNDFYFDYRNSNEIDLSFIKCLNYSPLKSDKEFLQVIKYFNQLNVTHNYNNSKEFLYFINKFIRGLGQVKLINSYKFYEKNELDDPINFKVELAYIEYSLGQLIKEIKRIKGIYNRLNFISFNEILEEIARWVPV
ncbi:hypothetical protein [Sporosarcina trichiuri]|uniref:hypothetical protein n=1 Tax=Sporosarcina trichiuri TaxID=3056445 RepID=UPI0025B4F5F1|nr:hypothetical protein [Sporosarcina sp. 0.2-SM1T-5]WJY28057.1 hypothetical protein QWT68_03485 [Sporosarcina sp. 0.2-SM1T-5]